MACDGTSEVLKIIWSQSWGNFDIRSQMSGNNSCNTSVPDFCHKSPCIKMYTDDPSPDITACHPPGVPSIGCRHPDVSPAPLLPPDPLSSPRLLPEAAPAVAGLTGLGRGLALMPDTGVSCGDHSTRLQKMFSSLFCLLIFTLL